MNLEISYLLPEEFSPKSRVWVYQSSRLFSLSEALELEDKLNDFASQWVSHGDKVLAYANLFFGQFVVLMADETQAGVSGCSTDSSVRFIKSLQGQYGVELFNRTALAFLVKDKVQVIPMNQLNYAYQNGFINNDTLYFNNLVQTKEELVSNWIIPIKESWLARKLSFIES